MNPTAASDAAGEARSRQYATFMVGDLYFGVDVLQVQEVLRYQQMTPVPCADRVIEGLINLRGQIVTAFDVRRRLGLPPRSSDRTPMNVVIRSDDGAVSLLVDEIGDVIEVHPDTFEDPPPTIGRAARDLLYGVYKLEDRLLLALAADKILKV
ncbi:MAG: chemotaxis protein CheW [Acidobacteria bacterium]|nr:chemotaxis protein CheW [Acidobacteriota bacterium]